MNTPLPPPPGEVLRNAKFNPTHAYRSSKQFQFVSTKTGYYMYVDTSSLDTGAIAADNNEKAHLQSAFYQHSGTFCTLSLWYHMEGNTIGTLNVFLRTEDDVRFYFTQAGFKSCFHGH